MGIRTVAATLVLLGLASGATAEPVGTVLVPLGSSWLYLDDGSDQGSAWQLPGFSEVGWGVGPAQLGYGEGDEATTVSFGPSATDKYVTTYFRHHFDVSDPVSIEGLDLALLRDDGAAVYLNGTEILRSNLAPGADSLTYASSALGAPEESELVLLTLPGSLLVAGDNVLAVEVHQANATSSDVSFDLELVVAPDPPPPGIERAPYLQVGTPTDVIVRWRTDGVSDSRVRYGPSPAQLTQSVTLPALTTEHEVPLSGLLPDTRTYYAVGTSTTDLAGGDADHFFETSPVPGKRGPIRIWVIGDSGQCGQDTQGCLDAAAVRDAYLGFAGTDLADAWLLLGDNAYSTGTDTEYTTGFFEVYPNVMRNTVVWPSPGNHEFGASDSPTESGPYYDSFTMPRAGEAGGFASGTEAYYAFDYGNVHFVALDSHDTSRAVPVDPAINICPLGQGGAMYQWLCADLAATSQDFVIVYWHHPPYTKGSHDSDNCSGGDVRICDMREGFLPVLEHFGVDLHLTGHSHSYERSRLIDGHYGFSSECALGECFLDGGDGDPAGDGAYAKATLGPSAHEGTVYSVVGSSSKDSGGLSAHPVMAVGINFEGSLVVDVVGRQLDGWFIDKNGTVADHFQILKGPELPDCNDGEDDDGDGLIDFPDDPGCGSAAADLEDPACDDGLDNDSDGKIDWDGGGVGAADPQCENKPSRNREKPKHTCGLGFELALGLPALAGLRRRRATRRAAGAARDA